MPELPEVETIVRDLREKIVGKKIKKVQVVLPKIVKNSKKYFVDFLTGNKFLAIERRGKLIIFKTARFNLADNKKSDKKIMLVHLKMTGQLIWQKKSKNQKIKTIAGGHDQKNTIENLPNKYSHLVFNFSDGSQLFYNDLRQFGYVKLVNEKELVKILDKFGYEPLKNTFTLNNFQNLIQGRKKNVKAFLLDQSLVAGLGNIYVDEVLFASRVLPQRTIDTLNEKEIKSIFKNIKKILQKAVDNRGTTFNNYRDAEGRKGGFMKLLKVYGRENKKCLRKGCVGIIKKNKTAGRGTHFCSICQK